MTYERIDNGLGGKTSGIFREEYRGHRIYRCPGEPVTGRYRAGRFGVWLGGSSLEMVRRTIDIRIQDEKERRENQ